MRSRKSRCGKVFRCSTTAFGQDCSRCEPLETRVLLSVYSWTDLGAENLQAHMNPLHWGLNNQGDVVGFMSPLVAPMPGQPPASGGGAVIWHDANRNGFDDTNAPTPQNERISISTPASLVMDINDEGITAGTVYEPGTYTTHLARWSATGQLLGLGPVSVGGVQILDNGDVFDALIGQVWRQNGSVIPLGTTFNALLGPSGYSLVSALDLNNHDQVLIQATRSGQPGVHWYVWTLNTLAITDLTLPAGGYGVLNDQGLAAVLSISTADNLSHLMVFDMANPAQAVELGVSATTPIDMNSHGEVVWTRQVGSVRSTRIWNRTDGARPIEGLGNLPAGTTLTDALEVNDYGQVLVRGTTSGNETHVFVGTVREGLNRWWATAGSTPITVEWTTRVLQDSQNWLQIQGGSIFGDGWSARGESITIISHGFEQDRTVNSGLTPEFIPVGMLKRGLYTFRIDSFHVSTTPTVQPITFSLGGSGVPLVSQEAYFVADRAPTPTGTYRVGDSNFNADEIAVHFAPMLFFDSGAEEFSAPKDAKVVFDDEATWRLANTEDVHSDTWHPGGRGRSGDAGVEGDLSRFDPLTPGFATNRDAVMYATVVRRDPNSPELSINYFFFYLRSNWHEHGGYNTHEGDWEGMSIFLRLINGVWTPQQIVMAQHRRIGLFSFVAPGAEVIAWNDTRLQFTDSHPNVFVGLGGHASYPDAPPAPGYTNVYTPLGRYPEYHRGNLPLPSSALSVSVLPRVGNLGIENANANAPFSWLLYPGHWGDEDLNNIGNPIDGDSAPNGPVFLDTGFARGGRWIDPWAWAAAVGGGNTAPVVETFEHGLDGWNGSGNVGTADDGTGHNNTVLSLTEGSDASISIFLPLPTSTRSLFLDYRFLMPGDGDRLVVRINGTTLWQHVGTNSPSAALKLSEPIDVSAYAGQDVTLELRLASMGAANSRVILDNISLYGTSTLGPFLVSPGVARVNGSANQGNRFTVTARNPLGEAIAFQQAAGGSPWTAADLSHDLNLQGLTGDTVTWVDPKDGLTYAAATTATGLLLLRQTGTVWTVRDLIPETPGSTGIVRGLTVMTSTEQKVILAGVNGQGQVVIFSQTGAARPDGQYIWIYDNLSLNHLVPRGLATPVFSGPLTSYVTSWNGLNIAGLDAAGQIQVVWWAPGLGLWTTSNLSAVTGAPALSGGLTTYLTSWGGINLAGVDAQGRVNVTWWVPSFGGNWVKTNLTQEFNGPSLAAESISSYVTPWGGLNIAGIQGDGKVVIYWWVPGFNSWVISPISDVIPHATLPVGRVTGVASPAGTINLLGSAENGHVIRYFWNPGGDWAQQDITSLVTTG